MDPSLSLQRWQQAFEDHPISTTRMLEKQLRSSVANNRDRLRGLVGGNYRELLSTADRIVYLDEKTKAAELHVSELGLQCGPPPRATKRNATGISRSVPELWLLQKCLDATSRALKVADLLRAAQLIVIARLLQKSLQNVDNPPLSLSALQDRMLSLRRQTLSWIDSVLTNPRSTIATTVRAACAYCLVTSASAIEVFQHTLRIRLEKLKVVAHADTFSSNLSQDVLRFVLITLQTIKRAFGRPLVDALRNLQRRPILQDLDLVSSEDVGSKEVFQLISEDVRSFSPYFKRDPISSSEASTSLATWTADACSIMSQTLHRQVAAASQISEVLSVRRELLSALLPSYFSSNAGELVRKCIWSQITARMTELGQRRVSALTSIADQLVDRSTSATADLNLWNHEVASMPLSRGSDAFLSQVHKRYQGQSTFLSGVSKSLKAWIESTQAATRDLENAKLVRWRDLLEEPSDEQEDDAAQVVRALSEDELRQLAVQTGQFTKSAVASMESKIVQYIRTTLEKDVTTDITVYHMRVIRLVLAPLRQAFPDEAPLADLKETIPGVYAKISTKVVSEVLETYKETSPAQGEQSIIEGLPSPAAFNLLQGVCEIMYRVGGGDIWSCAAVQQIKRALRQELLPANERNEIRWNAFDHAFLECALNESPPPRSRSTEEKAAQDYWHRTRLLFGILAGNLS